MSLIKHSVLHVCANFKHQLNRLHKNIFLALPSHWFYLYRFYYLHYWDFCCNHNTLKGKSSFVCGADLVSSRNHVLAPQVHPQTSLPTAFKCLPMKTVGQLGCFQQLSHQDCICRPAEIGGKMFIYSICDVGGATL